MKLKTLLKFVSGVIVLAVVIFWVWGWIVLPACELSTITGVGWFFVVTMIALVPYSALVFLYRKSISKLRADAKLKTLIELTYSFVVISVPLLLLATHIRPPRCG